MARNDKTRFHKTIFFVKLKIRPSGAVTLFCPHPERRKPYLCPGTIKRNRDMATQIYDPPRGLTEQARLFAEDALRQFQTNFATQHIFPYAPYSEYYKRNEYYKKHGGWYSTGEGLKSFRYHVTGDDMNTEIHFFHNAYLLYAELGVGRGNPWSKVVHDRKAHYNTRYSRWLYREGMTHRPAISMELRHLQHRMQNYAEDYLGRNCSVEMLNVFREKPTP